MRALLSTALAALVSAQPAAPDFKKETYPPLTLAKAAAESPCRGAVGAEVRDRMFSAEVVFQGAIRDTPGPRRELVRRWAVQVGDPAAAARYAKEISVSEGKRVHWMPVPEGLLAVLQSDLQPGDRALAYLVFVGCAQAQPVFTLDEFEPIDASQDEEGDVIVRRPAPPQRRIS